MKTLLACVGAIVLAKKTAWYTFLAQVALRNQDKGFIRLISQEGEKVWNAKYEASAKVSKRLGYRGQAINAAIFEFFVVRAQNNAIKCKKLVEKAEKK